MADDENSDLIAGERRDDLLRALSYVSTESLDDGSYIVNGDLPPEVAPPFIRAIMRVEAELLINDAELVTVDEGEPRSPEERRADAFLALALRVTDRLQG
ncbi:DUF222 domain-containing protein [Nocardia cyriacigeorgica]|jgi:hypothetical protein|uniref:Uncharacterized protein n=1 Tax=Nocardia cyriacigeorgica TaxID=135487 RepID=A0A2L2JPW5_9NOCA|nr:DUF222 domain-containing protein [Nocardia cyriacigeorgica]AVH21871.1 hypothetical protein C5B73_10840 [Nocardia cyriacigeorgica]MBF6085642.1 DUF222 domain-containing protein [Nocardia cyriacigeorgica]MBF6091733.1 DUF222 domain-containing protein [Nocardia cyriacigeorgica]MBF6098821.1 DUF222 domain-containing protein [Nocardia cyriacigeorgica]MBF6159643.1 DUF222 domain-containing protein [Nocardia cyriacigeorgica]